MGCCQNTGLVISLNSDCIVLVPLWPKSRAVSQIFAIKRACAFLTSCAKVYRGPVVRSGPCFSQTRVYRPAEGGVGPGEGMQFPKCLMLLKIDCGLASCFITTSTSNCKHTRRSPSRYSCAPMVFGEDTMKGAF